MFIKLGIIAGVLILGGMIFSNELGILFPSTSATAVDSLKDDVATFSNKATGTIEQKIDESADKLTKSVDTVVDRTNNVIKNEVAETGKKIVNTVSGTGDKISHEVTETGEKISSFSPVESISNIFSRWF